MTLPAILLCIFAAIELFIIVPETVYIYHLKKEIKEQKLIRDPDKKIYQSYRTKQPLPRLEQVGVQRKS